jgi:protease I
MRNFLTIIFIAAATAALWAQVEVERNDFYRGADILSQTQLPAPESETQYSLRDLIKSRGSSGLSLAVGEISVSQISRLFWAAYGITDTVTNRRSVQSYDNAYSLLLYLVTSESVYVYRPIDHTLAEIIDSDVRSRFARAAARDRTLMVADTSIIIAGSPKIAGQKRPRDGRKYMFIEAGRVMQNLELEAMTEGLGFVVIDNFDEAKIRYLFRMPAGFEPISILAVGKLDSPLEPLGGEKEPDEAEPQAVAPQEEEQSDAEKTLSQARQRQEQQQAAQASDTVLIFIPERYFPEQTLTEMMRLFEFNNVRVDLVSTTFGPLKGDLGAEITADFVINDVDVNNYDAVVFIGSTLVSRAVRTNTALDNFVLRAFDGGGIIASYGKGVEILARSGLLRGGVDVTGDATSRRIVNQSGGDYIDSSIVIDGRIITSKGQRNATVSNLETGPEGPIRLVSEILSAVNEEDAR